MYGVGLESDVFAGAADTNNLLPAESGATMKPDKSLNIYRKHIYVYFTLLPYCPLPVLLAPRRSLGWIKWREGKGREGRMRSGCFCLHGVGLAVGRRSDGRG